jgi:hypothetical protein
MTDTRPATNRPATAEPAGTAATNGPSAARGDEPVAESVAGVVVAIESLMGELFERDGRLRELVALAARLDERANELALHQQRLAESQERIARDAEAVSAQAVEVEEREARVTLEEARLDATSHSVSLEAASVEARADRVWQDEQRLAAREARFVRRWGWLIRSWRRRRWRTDRMHVCELLFVPTVQGYLLLDQTGVALAPGAILRGMVDPERTFVVTKIAALPFEDCLCAYLQEVGYGEGGST